MSEARAGGINRWAWAGAAGLAGLTVLVLLAMGREPWGVAGGFGWWTFRIHSRLNSQLLADPYSFTHLTHGVAFWLLGFWLLRDRMGEGGRLLVATALEGGWEILENTPFVIERFREATLAQGYYGDSVINSLGDLLVMIGGYRLAGLLSVRVAVVLLIALEVTLAVWIRDNVTLNVLMLLYPIEPVLEWQLGFIVVPAGLRAGWTRGGGPRNEPSGRPPDRDRTVEGETPCLVE